VSRQLNKLAEVRVNYYGGKELATSFRTVRKNTITIAEEIPEEKYGFRATADTRTVAEMLVHIAVSFRIQHKVHAVEQRTTLAGVDFPGLFREIQAEERQPRTKAQILELLRNNGESWAAWLDGLTDEFLAETVSIPMGPSPTSKSRFEMLLSVKEHEMHHRSQLMLIERLIGITPHLTRQMQARIAEAQASSKA
jgi:uncharacterized damage-inducible protein DinB